MRTTVKNDKGFTLIELMIVIIILFIFAAKFIPAMQEGKLDSLLGGGSKEVEVTYSK
jgi:prepilin-type N-terminal cleavage/methylation domain-containing protein